MEVSGQLQVSAIVQPRKCPPANHRMRGCVDPRAGLEALEKIFPLGSRRIFLGFPAHSLINILCHSSYY